MNKVICDVCGTDYPETEARCPLCDCVRADGGQTSAGNTEDTGGYTYTKGGRFSKSNVRKRLKASQRSQDMAAAPMPVLPREEPVPEDPDEDEFDEEELEGVSNRGLIIIVVLLLIAIIAVSSYLAVVFFKSREEKEWNQSSSSTTQPTQNEDPPASDIPCTGLIISEEPMILSSVGQTNGVKLYVEPQPADTTDGYEFISNDTTVVIVDKFGVATAVGPGETTITVKCGSAEGTVVVKCTFQAEDPGTNPGTDPGDDPVDDPVVELKLRYSDVTLDRVYPTLQLYNGTIDRNEITWKSSNEDVATVENGLVKPVSRGSTKITATYKDQSVSCMIYVSQEALDELGIGQEPDTPDTPDEPDVPDVPDTPDEPTVTKTYSLLRNGGDPKYPVDGRETTTDGATFVLGGSVSETTCRWTVVDNDGNEVAVQWQMSQDGIVSYDAETGKVVAQGEGKVTLTASVDGTDFEIKIIVN